MGGSQSRPLVLWRGIKAARRADARLATGQKEVRPKDFFGSNLFLKKVAITCDFSQCLSAVYPAFHRFDPIILLLFKFEDLFFQRLLFGK
ncbi:MAG: hypothetical protein A3G59_03050 [Candidatus Taylorbacteria bacterium RIFCSPLOWO2_12_FULL_47_20]|uniref:Uncharacterized protein n=2 Tax=Candidatus Tayloriibacteriota TaxID=1817919 RepID=A0A1G2PA33_9BACT|nr:MAG: hypothetical protein A3H68_01325 [Candidatus Taylorbacteria bacterium RIFCSPLOWO2_02_FULL_46_40]OHA45185.1 MAG: hypothetical protein A3G59_03050 [Candidatus Taylorbacteria bacterium RIFCSPLOWO2_12_FULL_47_20]